MVLACFWTKFQAKRSILDPFRAIFDDLGPNRHCGPDLKLQDQAGDGPLEWVRPPPKAPERSWHASGPSFRPNRGFSTQFGPNLMFVAGKPNPLSETLGSVQQQTSVLAMAWHCHGSTSTLTHTMYARWVFVGIQRTPVEAAVLQSSLDMATAC